MKKILLTALAITLLAAPANAQVTCIYDRYGKRCFNENVEVPYSPRTRVYTERRYYYDSPRAYRYYDDRRVYRRHRSRDADFVLGLGLGIAAGAIIGGIR